MLAQMGHCGKPAKLTVIKTVCYVPGQKVPIVSTATIYNFQSDITDTIVAGSTTPCFEISTKNKEGEKSDLELKIQIFF